MLFSRRHRVGLCFKTERRADRLARRQLVSEADDADLARSAEASALQPHQQDVCPLRIDLLHRTHGHFSCVAYLLLHPAFQIYTHKRPTDGISLMFALLCMFLGLPLLKSSEIV